MKKAGGKVEKVFLSYARADQRAAKELSAELSQAGFSVWDPDREILPGGDFAAALKSALDAADAMVVLLSPDAAQSRNVEFEISYALGAERLGGRLIPVVVKETKNYPWVLDQLQMVRSSSPRQAGKEVAGLLSGPAYDIQAAPKVR